MSSRTRISYMAIGFTLGILLCVSLFFVIYISKADAYPAGWTSDVQPGAVAQDGLFDICVDGALVHMVYLDNSNNVQYMRSLDGGSTWSSPVQFPGEAGLKPLVTCADPNTVYVCSVQSGWSDDYCSIYRSLDNGASWIGGWFAQQTGNGFAVTHGSDSYPAISYYRSARYFRTITPSGLGPETSVSYEGKIDSTDAGQYFLVESGGGSVYCDRYDGASHPITLATGGGGYTYSAPDVAFRSGTNDVNVVYQRFDGANYRVCMRQYVSGSWGSQFTLYNSGATEPRPKACPYAEPIPCRASNGQDVVNAIDETVLIKGSNPAQVEASSDPGQPTYISSAGSAVYLKRTDAVAPSGTPQVQGGTDGSTTYVNGDFTISFINVIDDWNVSGADPYGTSYTNGVTKIDLFYKSGSGGAWQPLNSSAGYTLYGPAWSAMASTQYWSHGGSYYVRGVLTDTAGNTFNADSGLIIMDNTLPSVSMSVSPEANSEGWLNTDATLTMTGSDDICFGRLEYRYCKYLGDLPESWTLYTNPVVFGEGEWKVEGRALDMAGNIRTAGTDYIHIDKTAPVSVVSSPSNSAPLADMNGYIQVSGRAEDSVGVSHLWIYIDDNQVADVNNEHNPNKSIVQSYNWYARGAPIGTHAIDVKSRDIAGNESMSTKSVTLTEESTSYTERWYFAEGNTRDDFDEYICVENPGEVDAKLDMRFMLENGDVVPLSSIVLARSRVTYAVGDIVPAGHDVSTFIDSDRPVICERPMYFNYRGKWTGGHTVVGASSPQKEWYFAEGTTREGFEEWITLQNPGASTATVVVTYMMPVGPNIEKHYQVAPTSRRTIEVAADVGLNQDVSVRLRSDVAIVAERPMYFNYRGKWTGGHTVVGASSPQKEWYFAEGTTREGFEEYITLQNPGNDPAHVNLTFMDASKGVFYRSRIVAGRSRDTLNVLGELGIGRDVSVAVSSDVPIVAERPMYFNYLGPNARNWDGGNCALGVNQLAQNLYFAEGTTREGFEEYITIQNPNPDTGVCVYVYAYDASGKAVSVGPSDKPSPFYYVSPRSRKTIYLNQDSAVSQDISLLVSAADHPVVVERPMYFNYQGKWTGGHIAAGVPDRL